MLTSRQKVIFWALGTPSHPHNPNNHMTLITRTGTLIPTRGKVVGASAPPGANQILANGVIPVIRNGRFVIVAVYLERMISCVVVVSDAQRDKNDLPNRLKRKYKWSKNGT